MAVLADTPGPLIMVIDASDSFAAGAGEKSWPRRAFRTCPPGCFNEFKG